MKLYYDGKYYLQKFDISFLRKNNIIAPQGFKDECSKYSSKLRVRNTRDHFTFVGPFVKSDTINWLNGLSYIVCYDECVSVPARVLNRRIHKQNREARLYDDDIRSMRRDIANNGMIQDRLHATKRQALKIWHETAALEIMRDHLEHKIDFEFPEGYTPPAPPKMTRKDKILNFLFSHYRIP